MKTRIITAIVALLIFIPILIFGELTLVGPITLFSLAMAVLSAVGAFEAVKCTGEEKNLFFAPVYAVAFALPLLNASHLGAYTPTFIVLVFYLLFTGVLNNSKITADKVLVAFALTFYVTASFGSLTVLFTKGTLLFPLVFVGAWVTDTFAYFSGYFLGKHKLIPAVSPKKTVEGAIGGSLATTITYGVYGWFMTHDLKLTLILTIVGLVASVVSQLGDLSASLIKRHYGIKDYGNLFPGHGGVLDRFDSILAVSAFLYVVSLFVKF
ncbi:MAG: phosphatidate cytidylyltransferase [Clostridia bacterium]|nr:phosphatidate cytidylyltransferase [Clostridia bacterium]